MKYFNSSSFFIKCYIYFINKISWKLYIFSLFLQETPKIKFLNSYISNLSERAIFTVEP